MNDYRATGNRLANLKGHAPGQNHRSETCVPPLSNRYRVWLEHTEQSINQCLSSRVLSGEFLGIYSFRVLHTNEVSTVIESHAAAFIWQCTRIV